MSSTASRDTQVTNTSSLSYQCSNLSASKRDHILLFAAEPRDLLITYKDPTIYTLSPPKDGSPIASAIDPVVDNHRPPLRPQTTDVAHRPYLRQSPAQQIRRHGTPTVGEGLAADVVDTSVIPKEAENALLTFWCYERMEETPYGGSQGTKAAFEILSPINHYVPAIVITDENDHDQPEDSEDTPGQVVAEMPSWLADHEFPDRPLDSTTYRDEMSQNCSPALDAVLTEPPSWPADTEFPDSALASRCRISTKSRQLL